jgi:hypothetical protein
MYMIDATLRLGVSHAPAILPDLLDFVARTEFAAENIKHARRRLGRCTERLRQQDDKAGAATRSARCAVG